MDRKQNAAGQCASDERLIEVALTKCPTRTRFEIILETNGGLFPFEREIGLQFPRTVLRCVRVDIGLMLPKAVPEIVGGADVVMAWNSHGLQNVDVVHGFRVRLRPASAVLRRDAFALLVLRSSLTGKRGLPRCSP
jgi:hypothetical protein